MNPIKEKSKSLEKCFLPLKKMYPKSSNKEKTSPYTMESASQADFGGFDSRHLLHDKYTNLCSCESTGLLYFTNEKYIIDKS